LTAACGLAPREKAVILWSCGKDSMLALWEVRARYEIAALMTTVTREYDRISMHGVRTVLLRQQAEALGFPLRTVQIGTPCTNAAYERAMGEALADYRRAGVENVVAGDLFLEDIRRYREAQLGAAGLSGVFPLWKRDTRRLAEQFMDLGFRAVLCCVDTQTLDASFAGRLFDRELLADLPAAVDPCGENGEFHTFVYNGPVFSRPVAFVLGERTLRDERFAYCDLVPA
jgi:uncharacterized protein (TIGR00290 family)